MKKLFAILTGVLLLSLVLTGIALADPVTQDDITFKVNVSPAGIIPPASESGTVSTSVEVVITNNTPNEITNIELRILGKTVKLDKIAPAGESATDSLALSLDLTSDQLGVDLPLVVAYHLPDVQEELKYESTFRVEKVSPEIKAELSVSPSVNGKQGETMGPDGASVNFVYTIENKGNVNITGISIQENMKSGNSSVSTDILKGQVSPSNPIEPGKSITVTGHTATLSGSVSVSPVLLFDTEYGSSESKADTVTVQRYVPKLDFTLTVANTNVTYGSSTKLYYKVVNTGNVALQNIKITNESGNEVRTIASLTPGNSISGEVSITVTKTRSYKYSVAAQSSDGQSISSSESVTVNMVPLEATDIKLNTTISADKLVLDAPGTVTITIKVTNQNAFELKNIKIVDSRDNTITTISSLLSDATETITHTMELSYSEEIFVCAYVPVEGNSEPSELVSNMISIEVNGSSDVTPTTSVTPSPTLSPTATGSVSPSASGETEQTGLGIVDILIIGFIVILVLVAIAVGALITINVLDKKKKAKNRQMNRKIK